MATATIYTTKDASMYEPNDGWSGWDNHHPVGLGSGIYRSVLYFPISFTGWTAINSATLFLRGHRGASGNHVLGGQGSPTRSLIVRRMTSDWGEGTDRGETLWSSAEAWGWNNRATAHTSTGQATRVFTTYSEGTWYSIDITTIVQAWFAGSSNYGVSLTNSEEGLTSAGLEFYSRDAGSGYKPYLVIDYNTNTAPFAPVSLAPTADELVNTLLPTLSGGRSDPDSGDYITAYQIQVYADDASTLVWDSGTLATTGSPTTFSKVYSGPALSGGTFYRWKARTRDKGSAWGPYSALQRFKTNSPPNPPSISISQAPIYDLKTLTPTLNISHSDNDPADVNMYGYNVTVQTIAGVDVWSSGDVDTSGSPVPVTTFTYSGPALSWQSSYRWTAKTKDQNGVWGNTAAWQTFSTHSTNAPINLDPSGNETISGLVPVFTGSRLDTDDTIASYQIILMASDAQTVIWDTGTISTGIVSGATFSKTYDGTALSYNSTYVYKVRVTGSIGGTSSYSANQQFQTPVDATVPVLNLPTTNNSPTNNNVNTLTPTFSGTRSGSAFTHYQIEVYAGTATTSNLGTPIWDSTDTTQASSTSFSRVYSGPALSWGTTYKWRVRVGAPTLGNWTGLSTFTTDSAGAPTLTAPTVDQWITSATPTLSGTTAGGDLATAYRILLYESNGTTLKWDSGDISQTGATSFSKVYNGPALTGGNSYQWQARYTKSGGIVGSYSNKRQFHVNGAPTTPTSLEPTPGQHFANLTPTFRAYFNDPDKASYGDAPATWVIEIRNNLTDAVIQTKTLSTGLNSGLNSYTWGTNTGGADTALAYNIDYKWRTYFTDSKGATGSSSSYQVFAANQPGTVTITSPSNGSNINTTRPVVSWTFSGATQAKYKVTVIRESTSVVVYNSGYIVSTSTSATVPTGYLAKNGEGYTITVTILDTNGLESNTSSSSIDLTLDAPPAIEGLSATIEDETSAIVLDWDKSALGSAFVTYVIYRRKIGDDEWAMIGTRKPETNTTFVDYYAGQTVRYEYRVTVVKLIANEPDLESPDSDIVEAVLDADVWMVVGRDRSSEHIFELFVVSESHTRPVQQEVFENLGTNRKTVARGFVLGYEGSIDITWLPEEKAEAEAHIDYILYDAGPHILKNPFGDVYEVTFGTPDGSYQPVGVQDATLTWIEIGVNTHNPTLTPDEFLAQIGAT